MKKLSLCIALFSSLMPISAAPCFAEESAPKSTVAEIAPDAKIMASFAQGSLKNMRPFTNEKAQFTIEHPANWDMKEIKPPYIFKMFAFDGRVNINSAYEVVPAGATSQDYADAVKAYMEKQPDLNYVKLSEKEIQVAGVKGILRVQEMGDEELKGKQLALYVIKEGKAYTFNGTAPSKQFELFEPLFQKMIGSIKIGK